MADEAERETARLFRVSRTIHELVRDRVRYCSLPAAVQLQLPALHSELTSLFSSRSLVAAL